MLAVAVGQRISLLPSAGSSLGRYDSSYHVTTPAGPGSSWAHQRGRLESAQLGCAGALFMCPQKLPLSACAWVMQVADNEGHSIITDYRTSQGTFIERRVEVLLLREARGTWRACT